MQKIAIYSDFNGVFNIPIRGGVPIDKNNPNASNVIVETDSVLLKQSQQINFDEQVRDDFNKLLETGLYGLTWHSTWNDKENILEAARKIGLVTDNIEVRVSEPDFNHDAKSKKEWTEWKARYIIEDQMNNPRPYIWIEDEGTRHWDLEVLGNTKEKGLIIQPKSKVGLTRENILEIVKWTQNL